MEHSKLPWRYRHDKENGNITLLAGSAAMPNAHTHKVKWSCEEAELYSCNYGEGAPGEDIEVANAELIVTAVNNHAALVEENAELKESVEFYKTPELERNQLCGCIVCNCEDEVQCHGCGAKNCGTHEVGEIPNPIYKKNPQQELINTLVEALENIKAMDKHQPADYLKDHEFAINLIKVMMNHAEKALEQAKGN